MPDCSERWVRSMETVTAGETARIGQWLSQFRYKRRADGVRRYPRSFCQPTSGRRLMEIDDDRNGSLLVAIFGDHYLGMVRRGLALWRFFDYLFTLCFFRRSPFWRGLKRLIRRCTWYGFSSWLCWSLLLRLLFPRVQKCTRRV
jgi:hypothetical protein